MSDHKTIEAHCLLSWHIPPNLQDHLDRLYLLHWDTVHYFNQPLFSVLTHKEVEYTVSFYQCIPSTLRKYKQIILSFRRITGRDRGYVLIRPKLGTELVALDGPLSEEYKNPSTGEFS
jgi:hypothetical protein